MKINKKEFDKWLTALYEERYPKTTKVLQDKQGYCCLGVGCRLLIPEDKIKYDRLFISGGFPNEQEYAPQWLKDIDDDFYMLTRAFISVLNDAGRVSENLEPFTHGEMAMLLDLVYNYKILEK